jgi:hypothetical protein
MILIVEDISEDLAMCGNSEHSTAVERDGLVKMAID